MEIDSVRVVRYDFYPRKYFEQIDSTLEDIFGERTEIDPQTFDFGSEEIETNSILYTDAIEQIQCDSFDSIQSFLITDPTLNYFCHTITIGTLTSAEQAEMDPGDPTGNRTRRENWVTEIQSVASKIGPSKIQSGAPVPVTILVEPTQESLTGDSSDTFSTYNPVTVSEVFTEHAGDLGPYGFHPTGEISAIDSSYLVTFEEDSVVDFPLSILVTRDQIQLEEENPIEYWRTWIGFSYTRLKTITSILLILHWMEWRRQDISEIDGQLYEYDLRDSQSYNSDSNLRKEERNLEQLRRDWVESHSATADEFHEIKQLVKGYQLSDNSTVFDNPAGQNTSQSFLYHCIGLLEAEFKTLSATLDRIETKLEMFISVVQDRIQSDATESNLELQSTVKNLTVLLAVIAVIEFSTKYLSEELLQSLTNFVTQSGLVLAGTVLLIVGFTLGYTHT